VNATPKPPPSILPASGVVSFNRRQESVLVVATQSAEHRIHSGRRSGVWGSGMLWAGDSKDATRRPDGVRGHTVHGFLRASGVWTDAVRVVERSLCQLQQGMGDARVRNLLSVTPAGTGIRNGLFWQVRCLEPPLRGGARAQRPGVR